MESLKPPSRKIDNPALKDKAWYTAVATDVLDLKFASLTKNLGKALNPQEIHIQKELAHLYINALNSILLKTKIKDELDLETYKEKYILFDEHIIDPNFPSSHPFLTALIKDVIKNYESDIKLQNKITWSKIYENIRNHFGSSFNNQVFKSSRTHPNAIEYIKDLQKIDLSLESKIVDRMNHVIYEIEFEGMPIDKDLILKKSYVNPSCTLKDSAENKLENKDNLINTLVELVNTSNKPIIIHGQPGHGKTSAVKYFLNTLAKYYRENNSFISILFFEFKHLHSLNNTFINVLQSEASFLENESVFKGIHTVIILDGLDERQLSDGSDDTLRSFISNAFRFSDSINRCPNSKLNILLTGRSQYIEQIKGSFIFDHYSIAIKNFSENQVEEWLRRFNKQKNSPTQYL